MKEITIPEEIIEKVTKQNALLTEAKALKDEIAEWYENNIENNFFYGDIDPDRIAYISASCEEDERVFLINIKHNIELLNERREALGDETDDEEGW
ncbi:MAG: hypothetical protein IJR70_06100 [Eubacterium sp.]|nr:hypothetical protein [Eubacterium sp.]